MKSVFLVLCILFLPSCVVIEKNGFYVAANDTYNVDKEGRSAPEISFPSFLDEEKNIVVSFPDIIGRKYGFTLLYVIPLMGYSGPSVEDDTRVIRVSWRNPKDYSKDFVQNVRFYLKLQDGQLRQGRVTISTVLTDGRPFSKTYDFSTQVKEVGEEGILVIEYRGSRTELPFIFDRRWYFELMGTGF